MFFWVLTVDPTIDKDMLKWVRLAHVPFVFIALHLLGGANAVWGSLASHVVEIQAIYHGEQRTLDVIRCDRKKIACYPEDIALSIRNQLDITWETRRVWAVIVVFYKCRAQHLLRIVPQVSSGDMEQDLLSMMRAAKDSHRAMNSMLGELRRCVQPWRSKGDPAAAGGDSQHFGFKLPSKAARRDAHASRKLERSMLRLDTPARINMNLSCLICFG